MSHFPQELEEQLATWRAKGLHRALRWLDGGQSPHVHIGGRPFLNFSSNDYLGLANDPELIQSARQALERYGVGSGASRLICGSLAPHRELEQVLADFKGTETALVFPSGYMAALGTITALMGKWDYVVIDKLAHACLVDAARLSGARVRIFPHNDLDGLSRILRWVDRRPSESMAPRPRRTLVVTESVFSMDGDFAPLRELVALKEEHGAWLMVDEAHATGLYGSTRSGLVEALGLRGQVEIQMGTLSKAVGATGGYIAGHRVLIDCLINQARSFIFSTAPMPVAAAAATAALRYIQSSVGQQRCATLWQRVAEVRTGLQLEVDKTREWRCAILPILVGKESEALRESARLQSAGILIPAVRYPTVARGAARLRLTVTAAHTAQDVTRLIEVLEQTNHPQTGAEGPMAQ
jgi:8-amino-7-oxononanoate synthase